VYLNDTSYNLSDSTILPFVIFSMNDADFYINYEHDLIVSLQLPTISKLPETILTLNQYSLAAFRFSSKLERIEYITSTMETFPLLNDTVNSLTLLTKITIEPQSFIVQVETDKRCTIAIKPWGLIQKYGFKINNSVQTKLKSAFEVIPLVHHSKITNNLKKHEVKRRLDSLQLFLTEYVVDVQYLEEIYKKNINKKGNFI
ncbi:2874_t:CDS:2, partial [Dentiscutata heterogama]